MPTVKGKQRKYIELLLKRKEVFGSLPTGFRKSLIYQLYPSIFEMLNGKGAHMLVVSALKAPRRTIRGLFSTAALSLTSNLKNETMWEYQQQKLESVNRKT